jgi:hypothetical protein
MWIADNSAPIVKTLDKINHHSKAQDIATYDFSTLYTSLPHEKLKTALHGCIERAFKGGFGTFLIVQGKTAKWKPRPRPNTASFSKDQLCTVSDLLIDNIFFTVGSKIFRQNIGIPMGTDCAPFMANLFLHFHEDKCISSKRPKEWRMCQLLSHNHRYIDDMIVLNAHDAFDQVKDDIYPPELVLNKENSKPDTAHFLDMDITIQNGRFVIKLYDKRDDFPFQIVNFPFLDGNVPQRIGSSVIISQLVRYSKCSLIADFLKVAGKLFQKVRKQSFSEELIILAAKRFAKSHFGLVEKYNVPKKTFTSLLITA